MHPAATESLESWCAEFILSTALDTKCHPGPAPTRLETPAPPRRLDRPGRPATLRVIAKTPRSTPAGELHRPAARARLLHTFWHHELQAAELMAWAILAFPDTSAEFRLGLRAIALDELRHMRIYARLLQDRGHALGDWPVRDWFWERARSCQTPLQFVTLLNLGLEGGNLDHAAHFAAQFRAAGDEEAARAQEQVGREEIAHVRFGLRWFEEWTQGQEYGRFCSELVAPLSPAMMRGKALNRPARAAAGFSEAFLTELESCPRDR